MNPQGLPHGRGIDIYLNLNEIIWGHFNNGTLNGPFFRITADGEYQTAEFDNGSLVSNWVTVDSTVEEPADLE